VGNLDTISAILKGMRLPIITTAAVGVAVVAAVVQYTVPAAVPALQRGSGPPDWWRLVTPLFVQTLGWYQVVTNLVTLALVGAAAERHLSRRHWAALFVAGTAAGQVAAFAWHLPGGGCSIAICGLAGGMVVRLLTGPPGSRWPTMIIVGYVGALTGWGLAGITAAAVAALVAVVLPQRVALAGSVVCAAALALAEDLHGVSLLAGMAVSTCATLRAGVRRPAGSPSH